MHSIRAENKAQGILPLLAQKAVPRTGDTTIPGNYCAERHVWIVDGVPLVVSGTSVHELSTKTNARISEQDDAGPRVILEMQTKTMAQLERDDQVSPFISASQMPLRS